MEVVMNTFLVLALAPGGQSGVLGCYEVESRAIARSRIRSIIRSNPFLRKYTTARYRVVTRRRPDGILGRRQIEALFGEQLPNNYFEL
jgi:hypothetical protein